MTDESPKGIAKVWWNDPNSGERKEYVLTEGATVTIGRSLGNEICIREQHVSRQHSVISYQYGLFMISDLNSANGTFVNDEQITEPFPLASGDVIRLYVPTINFSGSVTEADEQHAKETGTFILPADKSRRPLLSITTGPQEGTEVPLITDLLTIGRATANATWEIALQDRAVSRPHAKIERREDDKWIITDMNSSNGTLLNNKVLKDPQELLDGAVIVIGQTTMLFRLGGAS